MAACGELMFVSKVCELQEHLKCTLWKRWETSAHKDICQAWLNRNGNVKYKDVTACFTTQTLHAEGHCAYCSLFAYCCDIRCVCVSNLGLGDSCLCLDFGVLTWMTLRTTDLVNGHHRVPKVLLHEASYIFRTVCVHISIHIQNLNNVKTEKSLLLCRLFSWPRTINMHEGSKS